MASPLAFGRPPRASATGTRLACLLAFGVLLGAACGPAPSGGSSSGGGTSGTAGSGATAATASSSGGSASGSCGVDTWANYAQSFFAYNCSECHSFAISHGSVKLSAGTIARRISSGQMPPGGLSSDQVTRILAYLDCGAP